MNFLKILLIASAYFMGLYCSPVSADPPDCGSHNLSDSDVRQRVKHWSGLRPFAKWKILSSHLGPCVQDGLVPLSLKISTPGTFSRLQVQYELDLVVKLDGASGSAVKTGNEGFKVFADKAKTAIRTAEGIDTIRRFVQRFSAHKARLQGSPRSQGVQIVYEGRQLVSGKTKKATRLTFDSTMPGRISAVSVPHCDSLPVLPDLLRMLEVVSSRYPSCRVDWIDGEQRQGAALQPELAAWTFSVLMSGDGCPNSCVVHENSI